MKTNPHLISKNRKAYDFCLIKMSAFLYPFLEKMLSSKSLISIMFLEPNQFWLQENDGKNKD